MPAWGIETPFLGKINLTGVGYSAETRTLAGTIEKINTTRGSNSTVEILIRGRSNKVCRVELAPYWYIYSKHFKLPKGEKVKVRGFLKREGDSYRMLATEVIYNDNSLKLRNKQGTPLWGNHLPPVTPKKRPIKIDFLSQKKKNPAQRSHTPEEQKPRLPHIESVPPWLQKEIPESLASYYKKLKQLNQTEIGLLSIVAVSLCIMLNTFRTKSNWQKVNEKHRRKTENNHES